MSGNAGVGDRLRSVFGRGLSAWLMLVAAASGSGAAVAPRHAPTLRDSPGYYATPDPESASVALGRRLHAPLVRKPFRHGAASLDDLGRRVCRSIHHGASDSLLALAIRDDEFRDILWREFPQSRPAVGLEWADAWKILYARLHAGCVHAIRDYGGHHYDFVSLQVDSTARFRNFRLHSGLTLTVRDDEGNVQHWRWLRAVAERHGSFKIYSTDD